MIQVLGIVLFFVSQITNSVFVPFKSWPFPLDFTAFPFRFHKEYLLCSGKQEVTITGKHVMVFFLLLYGS